MCSRPSLNITLNVSIDLDRVFDTRVTRENLFTEWSRHETRLTSVIQYTEIKTRLWFSLTRFPDVLWTLDKAIAKLFCHSVDVLESKVFYRGGNFKYLFYHFRNQKIQPKQPKTITFIHVLGHKMLCKRTNPSVLFRKWNIWSWLLKWRFLTI